MFLFIGKTYNLGIIHTERYDLFHYVERANFDEFNKYWNKILDREHRFPIKDKQSLVLDIINHAIIRRNWIFIMCLIYGYDKRICMLPNNLLFEIIFKIIKFTSNRQEFLSIWYCFPKTIRFRLTTQTDYNLYHQICKAGKSYLISWIYKINNNLFYKKDKRGYTTIDTCTLHKNNHLTTYILRFALQYMISKFVLSKHKRYRVNPRTKYELSSHREYISCMQSIIQYILDDILVTAADKRFQLFKDIRQIRDKRVSLSFNIELKLIEKNFLFQVNCINDTKSHLDDNQYKIILDDIKEKYESDLTTESKLLFKSQKSYILDRTKKNSNERKDMLFDTKEKLNIIVENLKRYDTADIEDIEKSLEKISDLDVEISTMAENDEVNSFVQIDRVEKIIKYENIYCDAQILRVIILKNSLESEDMRLTYSIFVDCVFVVTALQRML